ncbi:MAG: CbtB domain-containing protein [Colwellia sp.]|jgi:cobalt transporter subunit CbtB (proposed)
MTISTTHEQTYTNETPATQSSLTALQHIAVLSFGAFILFMVGFSPIPEAHNAAHDTRHSLALPCH